MKLVLHDDDGSVVTEFDLGPGDGEWNIHNCDEADMLVDTIRKEIDED